MRRKGLALHTTFKHARIRDGRAGRPGSDLVVNRLADVLFIQCIRAHFGSRSEACKARCVLHAIFDPQIGVALKSMHENVEEPWTVESLAADCGMSRSAVRGEIQRAGGRNAARILNQLENAQSNGALAQRATGKLFESGEIGWLRFRRRFQQGFSREPLDLRPASMNEVRPRSGLSPLSFLQLSQAAVSIGSVTRARRPEGAKFGHVRGVQGQVEERAAQRGPDREGQGHAGRKEGRGLRRVGLARREREGKPIVSTSLSHQHKRGFAIDWSYPATSSYTPCGTPY